VEQQLVEIRQQGLSRSMGNPTPGVNAFSAPVFDYSGNIVLAITLILNPAVTPLPVTLGRASAAR
jgi:DNA-binding IclR family transcriptional regulator